MTCGDRNKGIKHVVNEKEMKVGHVVDWSKAPQDMEAPRDNKKASHFSGGKSGVDQIPVEVLLEWCDVFTYGETKYGRDNWKSGTDWHEFYGSALRHMLKFWAGEDIDPESGRPHIVMAIWNLGAIRYYQLHGLGKDTRDLKKKRHVEGHKDGCVGVCCND